MNYSNLNLRKYNLKTEFTDVFAKMLDKKHVPAYAVYEVPALSECKEDIGQTYYQHTLLKPAKTATITKELMIRGNAW
jgi:hypothetical protein